MFCCIFLKKIIYLYFFKGYFFQFCSLLYYYYYYHLVVIIIMYLNWIRIWRFISVIDRCLKSLLAIKYIATSEAHYIINIRLYLDNCIADIVDWTTKTSNIKKLFIQIKSDVALFLMQCSICCFYLNSNPVWLSYYKSQL